MNELSCDIKTAFHPKKSQVITQIYKKTTIITLKTVVFYFRFLTTSWY